MRVKRGNVRRQRHAKVKKMTKGFQGVRRTTYRKAKEATIKAGQHAYMDRRKKKRVFRSLWIVRLNAAVRLTGGKYSTFIKGLKAHKITLDRKTLSEMAIHEPAVFEALVRKVSAKD
jgi:large subunit ribosomal protein L20